MTPQSLEDYVRQLVDRAPPLNSHQQHVLRTLLVPAMPQRPKHSRRSNRPTRKAAA